jgi:hypothetical protein
MMQEPMSMAFPTAPATTAARSLDAVLARLAARETVSGLLLMGTTGTDALTPASDYDLLLVLALPAAPVNLVVTRIDGHLAEVYCTTVRALRRIAAAPTPWDDASAEGAIARWLRAGRIVHDRAGELEAARAALGTAPPPSERKRFGTWGSVGYNLAQLRRYLSSPDPLAQETVDWRLLSGLTEVAGAYFTARGLPWRGEKEAIRFLAREDPDFLDRFRRCLAEPDRRRKVGRYEELAHLALAPVGGPWEAGMVVATPGPGFGSAEAPDPAATADSALAFWQDLVAEETVTDRAG